MCYSHKILRPIRSSILAWAIHYCMVPLPLYPTVTYPLCLYLFHPNILLRPRPIYVFVVCIYFMKKGTLFSVYHHVYTLNSICTYDRMYRILYTIYCTYNCTNQNTKHGCLLAGAIQNHIIRDTIII